MSPAERTAEHEQTEIREELAPLYAVICHDDPVTTMDFVVEVFRTIFRLPRATARARMLAVHESGSAVVGHYPEGTARRRVERARSLARGRGFPLTFTVEPA